MTSEPQFVREDTSPGPILAREMRAQGRLLLPHRARVQVKYFLLLQGARRGSHQQRTPNSADKKVNGHRTAVFAVEGRARATDGDDDRPAY